MNRTSLLIAKWHNVNDHLPKDTDWKIVRCINNDECEAFYFMAVYYKEGNYWGFFDDEYEHEMQVTHWLKEPDVSYDIKYTMQKESEE